MDYQLWLGDCLEQMDRIKAGSVDAIICDLPYQQTSCTWDSMIPFKPLWEQYKRVIKPSGAIILFGSQPFTTLLIASSPEFGTGKKWFKYCWIWDKRRAANGANAHKMPMLAHEDICIFSNGVITYHPQMESWTEAEIKRMRKHDAVVDTDSFMGSRKRFISIGRDAKVANGKHPSSVIRIPAIGSIDSERVGHPTQKPVALLSYLVKTYTNEGETVLDNTFGSCSTGEAALRTGRRFVGIEKDPTYFEIGKARMERVAADLRGELNHLPMFAEPVLSNVEGAIAV